MAEERDREVLESGHLFFLFRPKVDEHEPEGADDVQQLFMVLAPTGKDLLRLFAIGKKRMPAVDEKARQWAFVESIDRDGAALEHGLREYAYATKTRGERVQPAARPSGEGVYFIADVAGQMHLAYQLELPKEPGVVQRALRVDPEATFVVSVKNPKKGSSSNAGLSASRDADYPKRLQAVFRDRRFAGEEPELLDYEGAEVVLVAVSEDAQKEMAFDFEGTGGSSSKADIFRELRMAKSRHPPEPLLCGSWA